MLPKLCSDASLSEISDACIRAYWRSIPPLALVTLFILFSPTIVRKALWICTPNIFKVFFTRFLTLQEAEELTFGPADVQSEGVSELAKDDEQVSTWRSRVFATVATLEALSWLALGVYRYQELQSQGPAFQLWRPVLLAISWAYAIIIPLRRPIATPPYDLLALYITLCISSIFGFVATVYDSYVWDTPVPGALELGAMLANLLAITTLLTSILRLPLSIPSKNMAAEQTRKKVSPEEYTPLWKWITVRWMYPLIKRGWEGPIVEEDVWEVPMTIRSAPLLTNFKAIEGSLLWKIFASNAFDILIDGIFSLFSSLLIYVQFYFIKKILDSISENPTKESRANAYVYAIATFALGLCKTESDYTHLWHIRRACTRIRTELMASIYDKALRRRDFSGSVDSKPEGGKDASKSSSEPLPDNKQSADIGKIVQLCNGDANTVSNFVALQAYFYSAPFEIIVVLVFLYGLLGWAAFTGFVVFLLFTPINWYLSSREVKLTKHMFAARDKRMGVLNELVGAIKFLKFYAYEEQWTAKAFKARDVELRWLVKKRINSLLMSFGWYASPFLVSLVSFGFYVAQGKQLTIPIAFTAMALYKALDMPLSMLPWLWVSGLQAKVSVERIQAFLNEEEVDDFVSSLKGPASSAPPTSGMGISNGTFRWNSANKNTGNDKGATPLPTSLSSDNLSTISGDEASRKREFHLEDINVAFPERQLTIVTGPTGSGKSALLMALLGEMTVFPGGVVHIPKDTTHVDENGLTYSASYCAQTPWLQQQSIKDNILFGYPFDEARYRQVLECCALEPDLKILEDGDRTEIGSKGVSLSGGQKARVALARAVYSFTRYVIMDDVFAAVDSHTASFLFAKLFRGPLMKNRTIILVTHHLGLVLPAAGHLIRMLDGRIDVQGSIGDLRDRKLLQVIAHDEEEVVQKQEAVEPVSDLKPADTIPAAGGTDGPSVDAEVQPEKKARKFVEDEGRATGGVQWKVYSAYLKATSHYTWVVVFTIILLYQILGVGEKVWVKVWADNYPQSGIIGTALLMFTPFQTRPTTQSPVHYHALPPNVPHESNTTSVNINAPQTLLDTKLPSSLPSAALHPGFYIAVYGLIGLVRVLSISAMNATEYIGAYRASKSMFSKLLLAVVKTPMRWIDTTPTGRILNRFSKDIETIDQSLSESLSQTIINFFNFIGTVATVAFFLPPFLVPAVFIAYAYWILTAKYLAVGRDLRRLEATNRSPIFSGFSDLLEGITTVRSFSAELRFMKDFHKKVDIVTTLWHNTWMTNRWLLFHFDVLGAASVFMATVLSLSGYIDPGYAALVITSSAQFTMAVYWTSRVYTQLEMDLNSVERVAEWLELPQEPPSIIESSRPPAYWPSSSSGDNFMTVENLVVKYAPELDPVLHGVSFTLKAKERVGLVGRTGSGKSTLAMAFLRFVDPTEGKIVIDGIDICKIGLHDLRSKLTIIPQDAVLFSGTIRENLDPSNEHDDETCLQALRRVHLIGDTPKSSRPPSRMQLEASDATVVASEAVASSSNSMTAVGDSNKTSITLETDVSPGGSNFSQGQRQLIALARALLRQNGAGGSITIMDESTSSVDFETDAKIQQTIREEFSNSLLITIAHRIRTIIDYDRLIVLDRGRIVEFDSPLALMEKEGGIFRDMCLKSGTFEELRGLAMETAKAK